MKFNPIIIAFSTGNHPPSFKSINRMNADAVFSPLAKDKIYSADTALWGISGEGAFLPSAPHVRQCLNEQQENGSLFLMALIRHQDAKKGLFSSFANIEKIIRTEEMRDFSFIGYDVIDVWTGISILCNAGFGGDDLNSIRYSGLAVNSHGLLNHLKDGMAFMNMASEMVPEHVPCAVSEIWIRHGRARP